MAVTNVLMRNKLPDTVVRAAVRCAHSDDAARNGTGQVLPTKRRPNSSFIMRKE